MRRGFFSGVSAFVIAGVLAVGMSGAMAADSSSCRSGTCQAAAKDWRTVRNGTVGAAHDTARWSRNSWHTVRNGTVDAAHATGQWTKKTGHKVGNWGSSAAKETGDFFTGH
ncbi:hypothetical protein [Gluconacetobacter takamatsuzukensis]|uniref:Uncharacterized protein n=1 Tax=Gluconacetobacter takamatsuzukensis TaxID=1286190 RepID=A0A7W4PNE0_9PROT|nr:hypothetical protein [Gluconacetobacter takamatsuzukensis]